MSVSIEDESHEESGGSRELLAGCLDEYAERRDREELRRSLLAACRSSPDAPWEALALLDQYQRRTKIEPDLAQELKTEVERIVFGSSAASVRRAQRKSDAPPPETKQRPREVPPSEPVAARPSSIPVPPDSTDDLAPAPHAFDEEPDEHEEEHEEEEEAGEDLSLRSPQAPEDSATRLRRVLAERDADSTRPGTAFIDRTLLRRDIGRDKSEGAEPAFESASTQVRGFRPAERATERQAGKDVLRERYELQSVLGRSASGTVYRALDRQRASSADSARHVCVKVLTRNYIKDPAALVDLEQDFHAARSLSHPNIVKVFDLDRDKDRYFIVMELLEGRRLSDLLQELAGHPMRRAHAFTIVHGIGAALAYAHERGLMHGDLTPSNVTITENGEVRVLEFGFARRRSFELHSASLREMAPAPSTAYASVERVNGSEPHESDDLYSLACIAYELLSGVHPFGGRSALLARASGRKPPRIKGLKARQWQALHRALLWTRGERKIGVMEFLTALGCNEKAGSRAAPDEILDPPPMRRTWLRAVATAAVVAAAVGAAVYFGPDLLMRGSQRLSEVAAIAQPPEDAPRSNEAADAAPTVETPIESAASAAPRSSPPTPTSPQDAMASVPPASAPIDQPARAAVEAAPAKVEFDKDTYVAREGDGSVQLRLVRSGSSARSVSVRWSLKGNSAQAGADFAGIGPIVETIPANAREAKITIPLVSDAITENTELFLVQLQAAGDAEVGTRAHAAVIIVDDD